MKIHKLTNTIGAEISGIDLSRPLTPTDIIDLKNALINNFVLFFRDQKMEPEYLPSVVTQFGDVYQHPTEIKYNNNPEIGYIFSGENTVRVDVNGKRLHADRTSDKNPPRTSMLYITECPDVGGDTVFVNTSDVYERLGEYHQSYYLKLSALHVSAGERRDAGIYEQGSTHPIVAIRPETQQKYINVNELTTINIVNVEIMEGNYLLEKLFHEIRNPQYSCRFRWSPNSVAWWDNFGSQHQAIWDYYPARRVGYRVLSKNLY
jgi:taurine dioxygenase